MTSLILNNINNKMIFQFKNSSTFDDSYLIKINFNSNLFNDNISCICSRSFVTSKIILFSSDDNNDSNNTTNLTHDKNIETILKSNSSSIEDTFTDKSKSQTPVVDGVLNKVKTVKDTQEDNSSDTSTPKVVNKEGNASSQDNESLDSPSVPKDSHDLPAFNADDLNIKIDKLLQLFENKTKDNKHSNYSSNNKSSDKTNTSSDGKYLNDRVIFIPNEDYTSSSSPTQFDLDFIMYSKDTQNEINNLFDFYILRENTYIVPDLELSHIKSPSNRLTLIKLSENLPYKVEIWNTIYKFYFKSIFKIVSKLNPLAVKHLRGLNTKLLTNDSLVPTPVINLTSNVEASVAKVAYGYANGLHELVPFLSSKFSKLDIEYDFNVNTPRTHEITVNWYYINSESKEIKISKSFKSTDLSFETSIVVDSWDFKDTESSYYAKSYNNILSDLFTLDRADVSAETLQTSSFNKHVITSNKSSGSVVEWTDGVASRMMLNGPIVFDFTNFYMFNTFISLLKIDNLLDIEDDVNNKTLNDFFIYLAAMIKHYVLNKTSPSGMLLKVLSSKFTILSTNKAVSVKDLHDKYRNYVKSGDIYPNTPVQFDFYFYKDTISRFSDFIILSAFSNIAINRSMKSFLPHNDKLSKNNFNLYAKDRSLLFTSSYISDTSFDFQYINNFITFDELIIEMYIKAMIITRVPDYIPLITRGQWKGTNVSSNPIYSSFLNDVLVKFSFTKDFDNIINFILNIICSSKEYQLDKCFKRKTRLVSVCPDIFERFVLESDIINKISSEDIGVTDKNYLSDEEHHDD